MENLVDLSFKIVDKKRFFFFKNLNYIDQKKELLNIITKVEYNEELLSRISSCINYEEFIFCKNDMIEFIKDDSFLHNIDKISLNFSQIHPFNNFFFLNSGLFFTMNDFKLLTDDMFIKMYYMGEVDFENTNSEKIHFDDFVESINVKSPILDLVFDEFNQLFDRPLLDKSNLSIMKDYISKFSDNDMFIINEPV